MAESLAGTSTMFKQSILNRIELRQQELLNKLDAVEKAVQHQKYATPHFSDAVLQQMYMFYKQQQFCDFEIKVQGQVYKVHRLVLASSSDYFQAMLSHDMMETREESTDLKGMTVKGVEPLIEYVYTGKLDLHMDNIHEVISGSTFLQISTAIDLCVNFLKANMSFENSEELLKIGEMFSVPGIKEYYRNYLLKNFLKFVESESFLKIDVDTLADYLSDDSLITTSEAILFHHCLRWYKHDIANREPVVYKLFEQVRMCTDGWPVIHAASTQEPFISNQNCKDVLEFNEQYMENSTKRYFLSNTCRTRVRSTRRTIVQFGGVMETNEEYDTFHDMLNQPSNEPVGWMMNHYFHPDLKCWFPCGIVGRWPQRYSHQKFVEVNGGGVMVGGYEYMVSGDNVNKICIKDVKMFLTQGNFQLWDMPSLQHERARHTAVYLDGYIYAIGGKDDKQTLRSVERLDCDAETWSYAKPLPNKMYDHAATVCDGKIYVSGGCVHCTSVKKWLWCYDPQKNNWNKKKDMISGRAGHGMASLGQHLYVAGGYNGNREALNPDAMLRCLLSVERYCVHTNEWTKLSGMKHCITFFEMTVFDGKIVVLGGLDSVGRLTQYMHQYDHEEDTWKVFGELPRPLKNASCGAVTIKLTETGCMEDETDDIHEQYKTTFEDHELAHMPCRHQQQARMMENFDPGDYLLDDDVDYDDPHEYDYGDDDPHMYDYGDDDDDEYGYLG